MVFADILFPLTYCIGTFLFSLLFPWSIYYAITRTDLLPGFPDRLILQAADALRDVAYLPW